MADPGTCVERVTAASMTSAAFGAVVGCARAAWGADAPAVVRARALPAVTKTVTALAASAALFGAIGGTYAGVTCASEEARQSRDAWNGALGGAMSGVVVGLRNGSLAHAASAGAAFALASVAVDASGRKISFGDEWEDGATPKRISIPYR
ncbi:Mitochondrial inner membrane translocase subunit Tim17/Tim22/Tim23/peroxisomal protein PMP24 [Ostreococcus tauri]|uniref:Mitochondrial inner membrane translocase subunit Tim17/Tim22/Tim23/peroxisomal protein PMP24 n=1 Tax=Ostreococcus tauri TaxID=70448 RepID=Q01FW2_OSTTA|nr:Mitochondrial inner membrane translocase subunit Tim17/Tim22/Tim23/peroxisomal protein PMP24 [Ostreococcus tauri]OUS42506.1 mitochondrial inner membrane translocase subunit Tim17/Tim22/Tim23/peroxisomal protein PMP24 [Ostreococcus tauri]CAL50382.1 Mitochondrial inner membrane translocase subunit Tim17/Tim22/Tim23/peroxisomal protein PMP24 [Ostreococcus tauri]|eukprot:XP_003074531.1 Mitochondrial inner membrane translocase subunit Tim17/Tim22/Tim23/peroxisomal protein PMP24 [Ostreococcus tauri]